jgi:gluconolactonase
LNSLTKQEILKEYSSKIFKIVWVSSLKEPPHGGFFYLLWYVINPSPVKNTLLILVFFIILIACSPNNKELFVAHDFTVENIFATNIEGPAFDSKGNLYVVNFQKDGTIGQVSKDGDVEKFIDLPEGSIANSIQFNSKGEMFLADFNAHNILKVDMTTKAISVFAHDSAFNQPNDICINKQDQIFASDPNWKDSTGKIWRIDPSGSTTLLADSMGTTNGIVLSPDDKILYVNESVQKNVWAFDVVDGALTNKRLLIQFDDYGLDGMKCDEIGNIYITRYDQGVIAVVSPDGKLLREVKLKGKKCSNLVFGGDENKTVFVTLQDRKGMEKFENDIAGAK